jgi:uncharacterized LabA/DUF88 family protein
VKKAIVYIDGFNLYYGLNSFGSKYKWLDLQTLAENFINDDNTEIVAVKYFTALVKGDAAKSERQKTYLNALTANCAKLSIEYGHFLFKDKTCRNCGHLTRIPEEKKTDVNIACSMLKDAYSNAFDLAYLISGDSDLVPPVKIVTELGKVVIVAHPPKRKSDELCKVASNWFAISEAKIRLSQFPNQIGSIQKPTEWCLL